MPTSGIPRPVMVKTSLGMGIAVTFWTQKLGIGFRVLQGIAWDPLPNSAWPRGQAKRQKRTIQLG
ncbi:hypothetical protein CYA_2203 [Synechococcus sp. JA-3-3Ab]|nr:hypothetical protein CYA_2203 [Synechococcus sp. JA-3-3Ab]